MERLRNYDVDSAVCTEGMRSVPERAKIRAYALASGQLASCRQRGRVARADWQADNARIAECRYRGDYGIVYSAAKRALASYFKGLRQRLPEGKSEFNFTDYAVTWGIRSLLGVWSSASNSNVPMNRWRQ